MFTHNSVATTCTASLLTGYHFSVHKDIEGPQSTEDFISLVEQLISAGFKLDFAIIHSFITGKQLENPRVKYFLEKIGFSEVFKSEKDNKESRHKETGGLSLWAVRPAEFKEGLLKFKAELLALRAFHNRPKIADPERLKFPELKLFLLRKSGIVRDNSRVDNPFSQILLVPQETFFTHIRMVYGMDLKAKNFTLEILTPRYLKEIHNEWRNEKCIYA